MRDFFRLLGIAILVFAIVGFGMIYSRDSAFRYGVTAFLSGTGGAISRGFSDLTGWGQTTGPEVTKTTLRIERPSPTSWIGLTGFPDETVVHFPVPRVGGYQEGLLDLHFDVQLAQGGDGLLSIGVNGEARGEIVLDTGHNSYDVTIPLTPSDMLAEKVILELSARGTTNGGQICPVDAANSGSAISLMPESAMVLTAMRDVADLQTALMATSLPLRLYLGNDEEAQTMSVWAAQHMARAGVPSTLVEDAVVPGRLIVTNLTKEPIELDAGGNIVLNGSAGVESAIAFHRAGALAPATITDWPVMVAGLTTEIMARNFRGTKRWTLPYKIADLPGGLTPTVFDLALRTSLLADGVEWIVRVSLNGNLLQTARLPGNVPDIGLSVELPISLQGLSNSLVVELVDTSPNQSICRAAPDAQAQLLPASRLSALGAQPQEGWGALVRRLALANVVPGGHVLLNADQATRLAAMLTQFLPAQVNVAKPGAPTIALTMLDKAKLVEFLQSRGPADAPDSAGTWLITTIGGTAIDPLGLSELKDLDQSAILDQMFPTSLALLVQTAPSP